MVDPDSGGGVIAHCGLGFAITLWWAEEVHWVLDLVKCLFHCSGDGKHSIAIYLISVVHDTD